MLIRKVENSDLDEWLRMRTLLWPETAPDHAGEISAFFRGDSIDIHTVFVLDPELSGPLAGFIELNVRNFAEGCREPHVPYVEAWWIDATYRGQGWGRSLMERAEAWAQSTGHHYLASDTTPDNKRSIAAHGALGFKEVERVVCFLKRL